jgi:HEPN domain-containing protein
MAERSADWIAQARRDLDSARWLAEGHFYEWVTVPDELVVSGRTLDLSSIPACYPNGLEQGSPQDYFGKDHADDATGRTEAILRFCNDLLAR